MAEGSVGNTVTESRASLESIPMLSGVFAAFNQMTDAIVILAGDGHCLFMNDSAEAVFSTTGDQSDTGLIQKLQNGKSSAFTITTRNAEGRQIHLEVRKSSVDWVGQPAVMYTATWQPEHASEVSQLEEQIHDTASMLEHVLSSIDEVLITLTQELVIVDITDSVIRVTQNLPEKFLGTSLDEHIHPDDVQLLDKLDEESRDQQVLQLRCEARDGSYKWMQCQFFREQSESSEGFGYWRVISRDISQLKQFEQDLTLTEAKYRTIFETSKTALILYNADQTIALVNAETERLTGFSSTELTDGRKWSDHVAGHDKERLVSYNKARMLDAKSAPDVYEFQLVRKDGQIRDILIRSAMIPGTDQGVASFVDITESKYRSTIYHTIIEQSLFGVMIVSDNQVRFANHHATKICGYAIEELKELPAEGILSIIRKDNKDSVIEAFENVLLGKTPNHRLLMRILKKDGTEATVDSFFNSIEFDGKKSILILGLDVSDRARILEDLKEGEQRYKIFSEVISDYAYTQVLQPDGDWKTEWTSETIRNMVAHTGELEHFTWDPYIHKEDLQTLASHMLKVHEGESNVTEFRIERPGGKMVWVREYCRPILNPDTGEVQKIYAVGQDITERRTMRQALHEFERRFRVMLENLSMIAVIVDVHGKLAFCNDYLLNLAEYSRDEILSVNWFDTFHTDKRREHERELFEHMLETGEYPVNNESEIVTRNGNHRLISWSNTILHDTHGNIIGAAAIGEDITDRRIAESKLRESEERYRQLFTIEPDALIVHSVDDKVIVEANDAALALYGYKRSEIVGMKMHELSAEPEQTIRAIDDMLTHKRSKIPLRYHKRKDGTVFAVEISAGAFVHEQRDLVYASVRDISDRVQAERELIDAKHRAELADKLKDSFIANMSHEIRTPLNIILGYTGIIESELGDQLNEESLDYFRSVERAGARLQRTVEQLLNLSSLQVGTYSSKTEVFDLCQNVDHLVYEMISLAHSKNVALEVLHDVSPVYVHADKYLVDQALANILDNAIKFTTEGGVFVRVTVNGHFAKIEVKDTGVGIAKEYLPNIFSMFSQEELGYTRPFDGLGIGLALTKMYMTEIGGDVAIESMKGEGTSVTLEIPLPVESDEIIDRVEEPDAAHNYGVRKHVLLIEDDPLTQKYMTIALQGSHNITFAESTEEALNILTNSPVDIILLDLYMKGTYDGLNTAQTIKSNSKLAHIPIVVVTAHEKPGDKDRCEEAGCSDFLIKPVRRVDLEETIERLTKRS